ncbi:MAG: helix-turn-helix domain-containing protein [Candidatus Hadarchaeales archaeon]
MRLAEGEGWSTPPQEQQFLIAKALSHPLRRWLFEELGGGRKIRLAELTRRANGKGFKVTNAIVRYHLFLLERAGLVVIEGSGKWKWARRVADVRLQIRGFSGPPVPSEKELEREIKEVFG